MNNGALVLSKKQLAACEYVFNNPLAAKVPRGFFENNGALKNGKTVACVFIGGERLHALIEAYAVISRFAYIENGTITEARVRYTVYGGRPTKVIRRLTSAQFGLDFPPPDIPCEVHYRSIDGAQKLAENLDCSGDTFTVIIADEKYAELAEFLRKKANGNTYITVYNPIAGGAVSALVGRVINSYAAMSGGAVDRAGMPVVECASNICHAAGLSGKLALLGLKASVGDKNAITRERFAELYDNSGLENGYADYSFFFGKAAANVIAFTEHSRWNAVYIACGFTQMPSSAITVANGRVTHKDMQGKRHACITSYLGLDDVVRCEYALLFGGQFPTDPTDKRLRELNKLYAYDFMAFDNVLDALNNMGLCVTEI